MTNRQQNAIQIQRLLNEIVRPFLQCLNSSIHCAVSADHHHMGSNFLFLEQIEHLQPIELGHFDITEDDIKCKLRSQFYSFRTIFSFGDLVILVFQNLPQTAANGSFIIDD